MMIRTAAVALALLTTAGHAQTVEEAARAYIDSPVQQAMMDDMLSAEAFIQQFRAMGVPIPEDRMEAVAMAIAEELAALRPMMEESMFDAAVGTFTAEELVALNEFYSSDLGASIAGKMQPFLESFYAEMGPQLQAVQGQIVERITPILQ